MIQQAESRHFNVLRSLWPQGTVWSRSDRWSKTSNASSFRACFHSVSIKKIMSSYSWTYTPLTNRIGCMLKGAKSQIPWLHLVYLYIVCSRSEIVRLLAIKLYSFTESTVILPSNLGDTIHLLHISGNLSAHKPFLFRFDLKLLLPGNIFSFRLLYGLWLQQTAWDWGSRGHQIKRQNPSINVNKPKMRSALVYCSFSLASTFQSPMVFVSFYGAVINVFSFYSDEFSPCQYQLHLASFRPFK